MQHHKIEITADHLQRFAATSPIDAVAELIWNALDADATQVLVETQYDVLGMMTGITVRDNGTGIPFDEVVDRFKKLGDSWKRSAQLGTARITGVNPVTSDEPPIHHTPGMAAAAARSAA